jgi:predicted ribosome quality control (RQC) complex YloA/Tae2 family protein
MYTISLKRCVLLIGSCGRHPVVGAFLRSKESHRAPVQVYAFKLARGRESGEKSILLVESGMRLHTIDDMPGKSDVPSGFALKLRKHVRSRRLEDIRQLGNDRVCQLTFGSGEYEFKVLLEFYASGNIVLVDPAYKILSLLRSHRDDSKGTATMSQHVYPIQTIRIRTATVAEDFTDAIRSNMCLGKDGKRATLKDALTRFLAYGPQVAGFCIRRAELEPSRRDPLAEGEVNVLLHAIWGFEKWLDACQDTPPEGCITVDSNGNYIDFQPLVDGIPIVEHREVASGDMRIERFRTFDDAVREFFSKIQGDRAENQIKQQEHVAKKKLDAIRQDHLMRIRRLQEDVEVTQHKADVLQYNLSQADAAMDSVREALAAGFSWQDLNDMIRAEKESGNPIALLIHSLKLDKNAVLLNLDDPDSRDKVTIEVDMGLSAHSNVSAYFDLKKKFSDKARRTVESNEKALAAAERNVLLKLQKIEAAKAANANDAAHGKRAERKRYWFENFHWFISSENYLVVSGRDAQQNEVLVKRYLNKGDAYVHAELHGASSTIVKNNDPAHPIPFMTLSEAGQACVARSSAWDAKVTAAAYWVHPDQVSKTAPSGEYLTTGSMMIRGKKNYLPSQPLVMGIGWLFKLEEGSIASHLGERRARDNGEVARPAKNGIESNNGGMPSFLESQELNTNKTALEKFLEGSAVEEFSITTSSSRSTKASKPPVATKPTTQGSTSAQGSAVSNSVSKRTQKKKSKKQSKYKDQDEEERELAMAVLGSAGQKKSKDRKERKAERKARMAARKATSAGLIQPDITEESIENITRRLDDMGGDLREKPAERDAAKEEEAKPSHAAPVDPTPIPSSVDDKKLEKLLLLEEGVGLLAEGEKLTMLDELTGIPRAGDCLLGAIPVCAPYQTVSQYKYHIKLVPGTQKKGKAYKQAVDVIKARFKSSPQQNELDLIAAISDKEGIEAILGNVMIQAPGLQKLRQQQKSKKKEKKKS